MTVTNEGCVQELGLITGTEGANKAAEVPDSGLLSCALPAKKCQGDRKQRGNVRFSVIGFPGACRDTGQITELQSGTPSVLTSNPR